MKKQDQLPGTETPKDESLSKAVEAYLEDASAFATLRAEMTKKREAVLALMKDRKLVKYADPELGFEIKVVTTPPKSTIAATKMKGKDVTPRATDDEDEDEAA
jgi:hypothetical protein